MDVSTNIAAMVTAYVECGIKGGTDWRNGLAEIISKRLKRLQTGDDIAIDLSALHEHDSEVREPLVEALTPAIKGYGLLIQILSDIAVFQDVDWEQDEHIANQKQASDALAKVKEQ